MHFLKNSTFTDIIYKSSYRKILDSNIINYKFYNEYVINYDLIEDNMTDLLLKNKKLLNETINEFSYKNEIFTNKVDDSITIFKNKYQNNIISLYDKERIYKFCKSIKNNNYFHKQIIKDFLELIQYLNKDENISNSTKIWEIEALNDITSDIFRKIFENQEGFTVDKIFEIFDYYLKIISKNVFEEVENYQIELSFEQKEIINKYYSNDHFISKSDLSHSISLFLTLILFLEEDKMNKISNNYNNIISYFNHPDLWEENIYYNEKFHTNLNELRMLDITINQIIPFYKVLGNNIEEDFFDDIMIKKEDEEMKTPIRKIEDDYKLRSIDETDF